MAKKQYPQHITDMICRIGKALEDKQKSSGMNLRQIARVSGMSVNSVKSVLSGRTGNIASYAMVANAIGSDLIELIASIEKNTSKTTVTANSSSNITTPSFQPTQSTSGGSHKGGNF